MSIEVILGPMFSGKTTELIRRLRRHELAGRRVLLIKWAEDDRYDSGPTEQSTHDNTVMKAMGLTSLRRSLSEQQLSRIAQAQVIGIDEWQFFPGDEVASFADRLATKLGRTVIVAGLDGNHLRKPFNSDALGKLVAYSSKVTKLQAVCRCGLDAPFTRKLTQSSEIYQIGGSETYQAVCRACYGGTRDEFLRSSRKAHTECYGCMEQRDSMLSTPSIWICPQCAVKLAMASTTKVRVVIRYGRSDWRFVRVKGGSGQAKLSCCLRHYGGAWPHDHREPHSLGSDGYFVPAHLPGPIGNQEKWDCGICPTAMAGLVESLWAEQPECMDYLRPDHRPLHTFMRYLFTNTSTRLGFMLSDPWVRTLAGRDMLASEVSRQAL